MGLFSLLFGSDPKKEIEECKRRIENFESSIETIKKNVKGKKQAHYHESARKNIETKKYQIKKEKEKIASLRKKLK